MTGLWLVGAGTLFGLSMIVENFESINVLRILAAMELVGAAASWIGSAGVVFPAG